MVVLAIITSLFVGIQDPIVQKFVVRYLSGYLSEKTGAEIKVRQLLVMPDFRIYIEDVVVKDLKNNNLATFSSLKTKVSIQDLLDGNIHLDHVELLTVDANLIQYEGEDRFNFAFLVDVFVTDTEEKPDKKPLLIKVDKILLKDVDFVYWNQNKDYPEKTENHLMDYAHIDLDGINLEAKDFYMLGDSIYAKIDLLQAKELSGLELKYFQSEVAFCSKGVFLDGMKMETNNSIFDADVHMKYNDLSAFGNFVDSVTFDAMFRPTDVLLSDIGVFSSVMYEMPNRLSLKGRFSGPIAYFSLDNFDLAFGKVTSLKGNLKMHPLDFMDGKHELNIKNMRFSYDDLANFYIPSKSKTIPIPESLCVLDEGRLKMNFEGSYNNFVTNLNIVSNIGNVEAYVDRSKNAKGDNGFSGYINAGGVKVGVIADIEKYVGSLDLNADFSMKFPAKGSPEFGLDGKIFHAEVLGNVIDKIDLDGTMGENRFKGKVAIDDEIISLDFNGLVDVRNAKLPKSNFEAVIRHANLRALNLLKVDSISEISSRVYVNMTGFDLDDLEGEVRIDSTVYRDSRGSYCMNDFTASIVNDNLMQRRINLNCDFFDFLMAGQMNFASLMMSFNEYFDSFVHFPVWEQNREDFLKHQLKHNVDQDFIVKLTLKDTQTICQLLMPSLSIAPNTTLNGAFTSRSNLLNLTLRSKNVQLGDLSFNDIELKNSNFLHSDLTSLSFKEIVYANLTETDTLTLGLENLKLSTRMTNDTIHGRIVWDDEDAEDHNKALIELYFHPHVDGGISSITKADVRINDTIWLVSPDNFVDISNGRVQISKLDFCHRQQSIFIDGYVPMNVEDTLSLQLQQFDISNFDFLFQKLGFDVDGFISGDAMVSYMKENIMVLADLAIDKLGVNGDHIGDANIESSWNNEDKAVDVKLNILDQKKKMLDVYGSYFTKKNDLDFNVAMDSLHLAILSPFLTGVVSRLQGFGHGLITVTGSLNQPDIAGQIKLIDAGCKVNYLNTFYTFSPTPTILINNKSIDFKNVVLVDTLANKAIVEGSIRHNNLKDFVLDLKIHPQNFLALATTGKDNDTFYGSAVASGLITVRGPFKDINLDINAMTRKGTNMVIPLNRTSTVKDNDFIVFIHHNEEEKEEEVLEVVDTKRNFALNLDINATDDANMKIILPSDLGTIDATGSGNMKIRTATSEEFAMYGNYTIKNGRFMLNLKNILTRTFNLKEGGTISWSGSPTDGRIDATGVYSVKTSLSSLGIQVDSSSMNSTINVECLIHLKNALLNPTITFGMRLPNATEDITQTVYSLVDTTNQAVMTSQALSLLVLGQFAYAGGSGSTDLNIANIFSGGMQVVITDNLNLGLRYHSGDDDSYDEYQVALRTELFENRLTIETNVGVMTSNTGNDASNIVGEFDMYYKLSKDGRLQGHFYNHSNYNSNFNSFSIDRRAPYTQGLGLSYSKSFNSLYNLFRKNNSVNQPLIVRPK